MGLSGFVDPGTVGQNGSSNRAQAQTTPAVLPYAAGRAPALFEPDGRGHWTIPEAVPDYMCKGHRLCDAIEYLRKTH